uniref:MTCL family member 3a n=1 Tax=Neolamprologus brichardi TaxID=32507 RepID=A0A3Q4H0T2_NEOBR
MDLRSRLEHSEKDWLREKTELLERFDVERREWESQLKDMQKKIEEVRCSEYSLCDFIVGNEFARSQYSQPKLVDVLKSAGTWQQSSVTDNKEDVDTAELDADYHGAPECGVKKENVCKGNEERALGFSDKILWHYTIFILSHCLSFCNVCLFQALKEIARVSEELCSYQDEIRKKKGDKSQIYDYLLALERENWITLSPGNTWQVKKGLSESWTTNNTDPDGYTNTQTSHGVHSEMDTAAPPIPPRTSSWNLSTPTHPDTELHIPESPISTVKKCHSPCALVDRKCSSPSIVRKFGAMLQENEGKVFVDGVVASCSVPANSNCNLACCHNRWSCDTSTFTNSKLSTYGSVQKSFSEVNIRTARKDLCSDYCPGVGNLKGAEAQTPPTVRDTVRPVELLLSSPVSPNLQGSRRNIMLEQKTAEFNRTLFQAEMGRGVDGEDSLNATNTSSVGFQPVHTESEVLPSKETMFEPHFTDATTSIMGEHPESDPSRPGPRIMNDHPWKPLTLAAYPRPEGSRSNYGAVERILKNYESAARAQQNQQNEMHSNSNPFFSAAHEKNATELDIQDGVMILNVNSFFSSQENEEPSSTHKSFSRPARPANRRLPSRWASRSPTSSSSTSLIG